MDKTPETGPAQEPQIPKDWNFRESPKNLFQTQINRGQGYLAFNVLNSPEAKTPDTEYFFGPDGEPLHRRLAGFLGPGITCFGKEIDVRYYFTLRNFTREELAQFSQAGKTFTVDFEHSGRDEVSRKNLEKLSENHPGYIVGYIASAQFSSKGRFDHFTMSSVFMENHNNFIGVAEMKLCSDSDRNGLKSEDYYLIIDNFIGDYEVVEIEQKNKIILQSLKSEDSFVMEWDVSMEKDAEGKDVPFVVFTRQHLSTGTAQRLMAPVQVNMDKLIEALSSQPPYPIHRGQMIAPWKGVHEIIGVDHSYSYLPNKTAAKRES